MRTYKQIILASVSPRRKYILEKMGLDFDIIPSDYEEFLENYNFTYEKIENLAYNKAKAVVDKLKCIQLSGSSSLLVLSADTVVVFKEQILGKPRDKSEAFSMLKRLSGNRHSVVTSICIINSVTLEKNIQSTTSYVDFEILNDKVIANYIQDYNPIDKAGSYGIQELPNGFVKNIEGSFENIVGLCPLSVKYLLKNM